MFSSKSRAASAYQSVSLESRIAGSGTHELVTMLFEGFLERVQLTKLAIQQRDIGLKVKHLDKAIQILTEGLRTHLDTKSGGELAQNLDALYHYCSLRLIDANVRNDLDALAEVHDLIEPIAAAWKTNWTGLGNAAHIRPSLSVVPSPMLEHAVSMQQKIFAGLSVYGRPSLAGV